MDSSGRILNKIPRALFVYSALSFNSPLDWGETLFEKQSGDGKDLRTRTNFSICLESTISSCRKPLLPYSHLA
jgi:hypothetical protein